ncbi:hypothetical protein SIID45300_02254 [Candidatus Magnetaquicoccaceae bacterium FCR-1]|uniref:Uncharacterized protein n=1 Tax=Candidatus Magnetaquiglobus chichijimensis TaxID=3141448 RepID=A0ABQ0CB31_9PROT
MIVLKDVSLEDVSLFGQNAPVIDWDSDVEPISRHTLPLYRAWMHTLLRRELGCQPIPVDARLVAGIKVDLESFKKTHLGRMKWAENKVYYLRELFVLKELFEEMGNGTMAEFIVAEFLATNQRSLFDQLMRSVTLGPLWEGLNHSNDSFERYSLVRTFQKWRQLTRGMIDKAFFADNLNQLESQCRQDCDTVLRSLDQSDSMAARVLSWRIQLAEGRTLDKSFKQARKALDTAFDGHVALLLSQYKMDTLLSLFDETSLRARMLPKLAGKAVGEALQTVRQADPDRRILADEIIRLSAMEERAKGLLEAARDCLTRSQPDQTMEHIRTLKALLEPDKLLIPSQARDLEEQASRLAEVLKQLQEFEQQMNALKSQGRLREAWQEIANLPISTVAVDVEMIRERWRTDLRQAACALAEMRMTERRQSMRVHLESGRLTEAIRQAETPLLEYTSGLFPPEYDPAAVRARLTGLVDEQVNHVVRQARELHQQRCWPELLLYGERHQGVPGVDEIVAGVRKRLGGGFFQEVQLEGRKVRWWAKSHITLHRGNMQSDLNTRLAALSQKPIELGMEHGQGYVRLAEPLKNALFIEHAGKRRQVASGRREALLSGDRLLLTELFPVRCEIVLGRFLRLEFAQPDAEAVQQFWGQTLESLWPDWAMETRLPLLVGC